PPGSTPFPYTTLFRSQVDGCGRLADAALDVVGGEDLHERPCISSASRTRTRSRPAGPANRANLAANSALASAWLSASFAAISPIDRKSTRLNSSHVAI